MRNQKLFCITHRKIVLFPRQVAKIALLSRPEFLEINMLKDFCLDTLHAVKKEIKIEIATSRDQVLEAQQLRHRVYCEERKFFSFKNGIEEDEFDIYSRHVIVRSFNSGLVYGVVRVVLSDISGIGFPMQRICEANELKSLCITKTGEISRFAITRERLGISPSASALVRLFLIKGIIDVSNQHCLTHWCAVVEPALVRLLRGTSIYFEPIGKPVEHYGIRQPVVWSLNYGLSQMRQERPYIWNFLTDEGVLWPNSSSWALPKSFSEATSKFRHNQMIAA